MNLENISYTDLLALEDRLKLQLETLPLEDAKRLEVDRDYIAAAELRRRREKEMLSCINKSNVITPPQQNDM